MDDGKQAIIDIADYAIWGQVDYYLEDILGERVDEESGKAHEDNFINKVIYKLVESYIRGD